MEHVHSPVSAFDAVGLGQKTIAATIPAKAVMESSTLATWTREIRMVRFLHLALSLRLAGSDVIFSIGWRISAALDRFAFPLKVVVGPGARVCKHGTIFPACHNRFFDGFIQRRVEHGLARMRILQRGDLDPANRGGCGGAGFGPAPGLVLRRCARRADGGRFSSGRLLPPDCDAAPRP
jgi:hypothetical protein